MVNAEVSGFGSGHTWSVPATDLCSDLHYLDLAVVLCSWIQPMFPEVGGFDSVHCLADPDQLGPIFKKHGISFHCFTDDMQVYMPLKIRCKDSLQVVLLEINHVKTLMDLNFLIK